jgi:NAD(P)-dependent dehydrogenase (short-subunit alcohol dehydrogenase family)
MSRPWVVILGASSGFGAAAAKRFAQEGYGVIGVHLDRRSTIEKAEAVRSAVEAEGAPCMMFNINAADGELRDSCIAEVQIQLEANGDHIAVLMHSLAFGSLLPLVSQEGKSLSSKQMTMTIEVMANSLVWWARGVVESGLMGKGGRIFAMTSSGSQRTIPNYGAVGAAKAALESHIRYLAAELAPKGITANSILAGITVTPALLKIPGSEELIEGAKARNPHGRLTTPEDVADTLIELSRAGTGWLTGNTLRVDGGEEICG